MASLSTSTILLVLGFMFAKCWCSIMNEYGEYKKVTVAISPHINVLDIKPVLQELEAVFRDASRLLNSTSKGRFIFKEVIFVAPKVLNISLADREWSLGQVGVPDIFVLEEGLFQDNMYTIQHKGCGEQGLRINLPVEFLKNATDKSRAFIHEWAHYRYGVFDEHGFSNDPVYPLFNSIAGEDNDKFAVTGCTNEYPFYQFVNNIGQPCQPPADDCFPIPKQSGNDNIRSSLMHKPLMPKVNQFCDDQTHNRKMPTKQNALCREQSTWKVISSSADFNKARPTRLNFAPPTFRYVKESDIRLVFAVDTKHLKQDQRISIRNAFSYFILFDLPNHSQVSIVDLKSSSATQFFSISDETEEIFSAFPDIDETAEICMSCSLVVALEALHQEKQGSHGFILLATASDISFDQVEEIKNSWPADDVKLFVIFFGSSSTGPPLLETFAASTGGQLFFIQQQFKKHSFLSPLTLLYEAFRLVYVHFSWAFSNRVLIDQRIVHSDSDITNMTFDVDEDIEVLHVIFTGPDFHLDPPVKKDTVALKHDGVEYNQFSFSHNMVIPAYLFTVQNPQVGQWTLSFEMKPIYAKSFQIIIRGSNNDYRKIINARCWISHSKDPVTKPMIVYSQIYKGFKPVIKRTSLAFLYHQETNEETIIKLIDNGGGDPDITKNDGIYTKYITGITKKGFYTLTVVSKGIEEKTLERNDTGDMNNCCGSIIPELLAAENTSFSRIVACGSFYVENEFLEEQLPPRRIVDLHMVRTQVLENNIMLYVLQWTAPGTNLDSGTAINYEMKVFQSRNDALNHFETSAVLVIDEWHTHGEWLKTEVADTIQTVIIELRNLQTGTYFLAMRALNERGNAGDISNLVEIFFREPTSQTRVQQTTTNEVSYMSNFQTSTTSSSFVESKASVNDAELGIIIGVTCGILFLFLVVGVILLIHLSRKRKLEKEKMKQRISPPYFPRKVKEPEETIYTSATSIHGDQPTSYINPALTFSELQPIEEQPNNDLNYYSTAFLPIKNLPMDNASVASSRIYTITSDQSSFYDVPLRDEINTPFNPTYTSSLRRLHGDNMSYKLGTDV